MQRSVNYLQVFLTLNHFRVDAYSTYLLEVCLVNLFADNLDKVLVGSKLHVGYSNLVDFVDDAGIVG